MASFTLSVFVLAAVLWFESGNFMVRVTEMIQRSVALCRDDFVASRLAALAEHFGARVVSLPIQGEGLSVEYQNNAREFVERILLQRLRNRGRRRG